MKVVETGYHIISVTNDSGLTRQIESALGGAISSVRAVGGDDLFDEELSAKSIVFLDARVAEGGVAGLITRIKNFGQGANILVVAPNLDVASVLESMRAGATDHLSFPINPDETAEAVRRVLERENGGNASGLIIAVFSLKGGQGVTSLASNLADHIHVQTRETCLLADLNLYMGNACVALDLQCAYTPFDLVGDLDRADDNLLFSSLVQYERGFHVLGISDLIAEASEITGDELAAMLRLLHRHVRYTVLDLPHDLSERTLAGLDAADLILLVTQQDVPSLKSAQLALRIFTDLDYDADKFGVVVNRYLERNEIELQDIENSLKRPVYATIRNDYRASAETYNKGQTVDMAAPKSRLNQDLAKLAGQVTGVPIHFKKQWDWRDLFRS